MDIEFKSKISDSVYCICSSCNDTGRVMKVSLPVTKFFDGHNLSTQHNEYWLCCKCRNKLSYALDFPEDEVLERI